MPEFYSTHMVVSNLRTAIYGVHQPLTLFDDEPEDCRGK